MNTMNTSSSRDNLHQALDHAEHEQQTRHKRDRKRLDDAIRKHRRLQNLTLLGGLASTGLSLYLFTTDRPVFGLLAHLSALLAVYLLWTCRFKAPAPEPIPVIQGFWSKPTKPNENCKTT